MNDAGSRGRLSQAVTKLFGPLAVIVEPIVAVLELTIRLLRRIARGLVNVRHREDDPGRIVEPGGAAAVPLAVALVATPVVVTLLYIRNGFGWRWFVGGFLFYALACVWLRRKVGDPMVPSGTIVGTIRRYVREIERTTGVRNLDRVGVACSILVLWQTLPRTPMWLPIIGSFHVFQGHTEFLMPAVFHFVGFTVLASEPVRYRAVPDDPRLPPSQDPDPDPIDPTAHTGPPNENEPSGEEAG